MSLFSHHSRDALRQRYVDAWRRSRERLPLEPLEAQIADVVAEHPEYHALLTDEHSLTADFSGGAGNPFLHLSLHLALREQVGTDRPAGIAAVHRELSRRLGTHDAEHRMMEVLATALWEAQQRGIPGDEQNYLERLRQLR